MTVEALPRPAHSNAGQLPRDEGTRHDQAEGGEKEANDEKWRGRARTAAGRGGDAAQAPEAEGEREKSSRPRRAFGTLARLTERTDVGAKRAPPRDGGGEHDRHDGDSSDPTWGNKKVVVVKAARPDLYPGSQRDGGEIQGDSRQRADSRNRAGFPSGHSRNPPRGRPYEAQRGEAFGSLGRA